MKLMPAISTAITALKGSLSKTPISPAAATCPGPCPATVRPSITTVSANVIPVATTLSLATRRPSLAANRCVSYAEMTGSAGTKAMSWFMNYITSHQEKAQDRTDCCQRRRTIVRAALAVTKTAARAKPRIRCSLYLCGVYKIVKWQVIDIPNGADCILAMPPKGGLHRSGDERRTHCWRKTQEWSTSRRASQRFKCGWLAQDATEGSDELAANAEIPRAYHTPAENGTPRWASRLEQWEERRSATPLARRRISYETPESVAARTLPCLCRTNAAPEVKPSYPSRRWRRAAHGQRAVPLPPSASAPRRRPWRLRRWPPCAPVEGRRRIGAYGVPRFHRSYGYPRQFGMMY